MFDFVKFVVVRFGLKITLDKTLAGVERALQSRKESIQGLNKESKVIGTGSSKD